MNTVDKKNMNKLYNLSDLYVVSSRSEGGPKAVLEAAFAGTMILSTGVGLAPDFLHPGVSTKRRRRRQPRSPGPGLPCSGEQGQSWSEP